jgi:hypothetical protein
VAKMTRLLDGRLRKSVLIPGREKISSLIHNRSEKSHISAYLGLFPRGRAAAT